MTGISIDDFVPRRPVDNRLSLKIYFRAADSILKQANIYRAEANSLELYILLLRYASLVTDTIPLHGQYRGLDPLERAHLKRKLKEAVEELETLKPGVQSQFRQRNLLTAAKAKSPAPVQQEPVVLPHVYKTASPSHNNSSILLNLPKPSAEALARHSLFRWTSSHKPTETPPLKVHYPRLLDNPPAFQPERVSERQTAIGGWQDYSNGLQAAEYSYSQMDSMNGRSESFQPIEETPKPPSQFDLVNQLQIHEPAPLPILPVEPAPPPVPAPVQNLDVMPEEPPDNLSGKVLQPTNVHISTKLMDEFLRVAEQNTHNSLETCGVLAGSLKGGTFSVTTLIIPKQDSTPNTCEAKEEVEIFNVQDERSLFPLGWIHTHPTQSCFMSSVDIHTHYSYQALAPEAIAIVMAPEDTSRKFGIFRLSDPGGMNVIRTCTKRGFHGHESPSDGSPIYEKCSHVNFDPKVGFEVIDLR